MAIQSILRPKRVGEVLPLEVDFAKYLLPGEAIESATCDVVVFSGVDALPSDLIYELLEIHGTKVFQRIKAGVPGVVYLIKFTAVTGLERELVWYVRLQVLPDEIPANDITVPMVVTSRPYPIEDVASIIAQQDLRSVVGITPDSGEINVLASFIDADLYGTLIVVTYPNWPPESVEVAAAFIEAEIEEILVTYPNWPPESVTVAQSFEVADLYGGGVTYPNWPAEGIGIAQTLTDADFYV